MRKAPPPLAAAWAGKRRKLPRPTALPAMARTSPSRDAQRSFWLMQCSRRPSFGYRDSRKYQLSPQAQSLFAVHDQRHRAVVDQLDLHVRAEAPGRRRHAQRLHRVDERLVERDGDVGRGGIDVARPAALAAIAIER